MTANNSPIDPDITITIDGSSDSIRLLLEAIYGIREDNEKVIRILADSFTAYTQRKVAETAKAYGGCTKCYGKGYATTKSQIVGFGTDGDIGGWEGKYKKDLPIRMLFCSCGRGKQLVSLMKVKVDEVMGVIEMSLPALTQETEKL